MGAKLNRGGSRQDYQTPTEFLYAVENKLDCSFWRDLAATDENHIDGVNQWFTPEQDSLKQDWHGRDYYEVWQWLNPPFSNITPWVKKASETNAHIGMLVPASVGANWWRDYVHNKAHVLLLNGRITFVGEKDPYPKDCALLLYTPMIKGGYEVWSWNAS